MGTTLGPYYPLPPGGSDRAALFLSGDSDSSSSPGVQPLCHVHHSLHHDPTNPPTRRTAATLLGDALFGLVGRHPFVVMHHPYPVLVPIEHGGGSFLRAWIAGVC